MQQRRLRLGDILDDYCPRERRITNHAVVAMIDEEVKQTRCTTCDADHEYKQARVPAPRRKKESSVARSESVEAGSEPRPALVNVEPAVEDETQVVATSDSFEVPEPPSASLEEPPVRDDDEGPVHRRLIRATLPRPEGQAPERKNPEFTVRQPGGGGRDFDGNRNGQRQGHGRRMRAHGGTGGGQPSRFGGSRQGHPQRQGDNRPASPGGHRGGGRPGPGQGRGPRSGSGRKRGR
jgi:hypothetical protein